MRELKINSEKSIYNYYFYGWAKLYDYSGQLYNNMNIKKYIWHYYKRDAVMKLNSIKHIITWQDVCEYIDKEFEK